MPYQCGLRPPQHQEILSDTCGHAHRHVVLLLLLMKKRPPCRQQNDFRVGPTAMLLLMVLVRVNEIEV